MPNKKQTEAQLRAKRIRNLERSLDEDRLGMVAITKALLRDHPDPDLALQRVESLCRAAAKQPRTPARTKNMLNVGRQIVERAVAMVKGQPQPLWTDEDGQQVPNTDPKKIKRIEDGAQQPDQVGLVLNGNGDEDPAADVEEAIVDQAATFERIRDSLLHELRFYGSMTETEMFHRYRKRADAFSVKDYVLHKRRRELATRGLIEDAGFKKNNETVWKVIA